MMDLIYTARCIAVVLAVPFAVGVPVRWLLGGRRPLSAADWIQVPFLGVTVPILVLQNLIYLEVPVGWSAPFLWGTVAALWLWLLADKQFGASLRTCPRAVFGTALAVYLIQGLGLLTMGARDYFGRGWWDQYWYTAQAEFFLDYGASASAIPLIGEYIRTGTVGGPTLAQFGDDPLLFQAWYHAADRAGQGVLQAFFTFTGRTETRDILAPTILLSPTLLVLAVWSLCTRLGVPRGAALVAGAAAGLLPGTTLLQLEGMLSQALATPILLYGIVALDEWRAAMIGSRPPSETGRPAEATRPVGPPAVSPPPAALYLGKPREPSGAGEPGGAARLATTSLQFFPPAILFGGMISTFPEFTLLLAGILGLLLLLTVPGPAPAWKTLGWGVVLFLAPFALNPGFTRMAVFIQVQRVVSDREPAQAVNQYAYPWALELEGLNRLWLGDLFPYPEGALDRTRVYGAALLALVLAFAGFGRYCFTLLSRGRSLWTDPVARRPLVLALTVFALAASPGLLVIRDAVTGVEHPYQLYKSLLSLAPLFVVGIALLVPSFADPVPRAILTGLLALAAGVGLIATAHMALVSTDSRPLTKAKKAAWSGWDRQPGRVLHTPEIRKLRARMEGLPTSRILIACPEAYLSSWLSFFARRHHVWMGNPKLVCGIDDGWCDLLTKPEARPLVDLDNLPGDLLVLTYHKAPGMQMTLPPEAHVEWKNAAYQLWRPPAGPWILPLRFETTIEPEAGETFLLHEGTTTIDVFSSHPAEATFHATFQADPRAPKGSQVDLQVTATSGFEGRWAVGTGPRSLTLPVGRGRTTITIALAEPVPQVPQEDGTLGPPLLTVEGLRVELAEPAKR